MLEEDELKELKSVLKELNTYKKLYHQDVNSIKLS